MARGTSYLLTLTAALLLMPSARAATSHGETVVLEATSSGCSNTVHERVELKECAKGWRRGRHVVRTATLDRLRTALLSPARTFDELSDDLCRQLLHVSPGGSDYRRSAALEARLFQIAGTGHAFRLISTSSNSLRLVLPGDPPIEATAFRHSGIGLLCLPWRIRAGELDVETWSLDVSRAAAAVFAEAGIPQEGLDVGAALRAPIPPVGDAPPSGPALSTEKWVPCGPAASP